MCGSKTLTIESAEREKELIEVVAKKIIYFPIVELTKNSISSVAKILLSKCYLNNNNVVLNLLIQNKCDEYSEISLDLNNKQLSALLQAEKDDEGNDNDKEYSDDNDDDDSSEPSNKKRKITNSSFEREELFVNFNQFYNLALEKNFLLFDNIGINEFSPENANHTFYKLQFVNDKTKLKLYDSNTLMEKLKNENFISILTDNFGNKTHLGKKNKIIQTITLQKLTIEKFENYFVITGMFDKKKQTFRYYSNSKNSDDNVKFDNLFMSLQIFFMNNSEATIIYAFGDGHGNNWQFISTYYYDVKSKLLILPQKI